MLYDGKIAFVTGGASGIGRALCEALAARGSTVIVADRNLDGATRVAESICAQGGKAQARQVDVSDRAAFQRAITDAAAEHGRLDYMFNNAGVNVVGDARDFTDAHWQRIIDVNLWGTIQGTRTAYALMEKQGFGHIVNMASLAGLAPFPGNIAYATSKHGIVGLSMSLRAEAEDLGVKVSVVCPSYVQTGILEDSPMLNMSREKVLGQIPVKILGVQEAARLTLDGVARNKAIIVFPLFARIMWWLYRLNVNLIHLMGRQMTRDMRSIRQPDAAQGSTQEPQP